jgi:Ni2+-binding GTPase involved in maturation of urease and hydrogenase
MITTMMVGGVIGCGKVMVIESACRILLQFTSELIVIKYL